MKTKPELKFKMESVGIQPEEDDDLHLCPARTRPFWPKKIISWWTASFPNEKPPYSYSTLIAYAILSSKYGRLTLNDIYIWISKTYPYFETGKGSWQNSIRHNLSLNKKWFFKVDRRPTRVNPSKGCYWTLIAGTEHTFIENLTEETSHNRKQNDIGLAADLSIGKRRGACFYNDNVTPSTSTPHLKLPKIASIDTPPLTPTKPVKMTPISYSEDSDNDSGVDVNPSYTRKPSRKRARTTFSENTNSPIHQQQTSMNFSSNEMDQWLLEQSIINHTFKDNLSYQNSLISPMSDYQPSQQQSYHFMNTNPLLNNSNNEKNTITVHLNQQLDNTSYFMLLNNVYPNFLPEANTLQFPSFIPLQDYFYL